MKNKPKFLKAIVFSLLFFISACSSNEDTYKLDVYKSPTCGCCAKWVKHVNSEGILTKVHNSADMSLIKDTHNVPKLYRSCHTSITKDGYVFEGHIPAKVIKKYLDEKPEDTIGLVVPGMPLGSPGMEYQGKFNPYDVFLIHKDGTLSKYMKLETLKEQFE